MDPLTLLSDTWEVILAVIYIIYNEVKRRNGQTNNLLADKLKLSRQLAKEEQKDIDKKYITALQEIESFVVNKFKHYKQYLLANFDGNADIIRWAADGILLNIMLKVQHEVMSHIKTNGYHELSPSELDSYISHISDCVFDIFDRKLTKTEDSIEIKKFIVVDDIEDYIRDIISTSINISNRTLTTKKIVDNL